MTKQSEKCVRLNPGTVRDLRPTESRDSGTAPGLMIIVSKCRDLLSSRSFSRSRLFQGFEPEDLQPCPRG